MEWLKFYWFNWDLRLCPLANCLSYDNVNSVYDCYKNDIAGGIYQSLSKMVLFVITAQTMQV